ncbi:hypothetical protein [Collinsella aerofaciens]|uniref:hypothetical protein n=1 Tax=Collinsella aerofaciens TaxID=74426 RepID=UPI003562BE3D
MEYIIMAPADGARLAACKNCRPLLVGHRHGTVVVITREGTRGGTVLQRVQHRIARRLDRIAVRIHSLGANLLVHRLILANSLRSLYVSV